MKEQRLGWCPVATSSTRSLQRSITRRFLHTLTPKSLLWAPHEPIPSSAAQRQPLSPGIPWYPQGDSPAAPYSPPQEAPLTHKLLHPWHSCFQTGESPLSPSKPCCPPCQLTPWSQITTAEQLQIKFPLQFSPGPMKPQHTENWQEPQPGFYPGERTCLEIQLTVISPKNTAIIPHLHMLTRSGNIKCQFAG